MLATDSDFPIDRISSDDVPEAERLARARQAYARAIGDAEITPRGGSSFVWRGALRKLPGLALASIVSSAVHVARRAGGAGDGDLILTATIEGRLRLRHDGRETMLRPGEVAVTRGRDAAETECEPGSRWVELRVPPHVLAPMNGDLDAVLASAIAAPEPLSMLLKYADVLLDSSGLERPETLSLAVAHVHEIVSLVLGAARHGGDARRPRGVGAARLRAIKTDIVENACSRELSIVVVAERHRVSARYVRKLFESEGTTFSQFLLKERLTRARHRLTDPRSRGETISSIAFACGFGDLSYFNRVFRRAYGATPTAVRNAARLQPAHAAGGAEAIEPANEHAIPGEA